MHPGALRALEFDRIVEAVRSFALTPMGFDRLTALTPATEPQIVSRLLAGTTETRRYLAGNALFPLRASSELLQILDLLVVEGRALEPLRLLALAAFVDSVDDSRTAIRRAAGAFALLEAAIGGAASFKSEVGQTRATIDPSGEVVDDASPELKSLRDRLRKQRTRLRGTLESFFRGRDTAKYVQEQVVSERNGRYVLVIKSEHRSALPGIVHGASASGASLYMEPLSTVEINNEIVALEEQEAEEVRRILLALTDAFRSRGGDMRRTVDAATDLDVLQARARFSDIVDGVEPVTSTDGAFDLQAARHPLLLPQVLARLADREEGAEAADLRRRARSARMPVPVTIKVVPPSTVLLVTGPNTGGKTVAIKTAGLLALMAQAGLHIPAADGSRLPVFRTVFADIGDEQSIEQSLSTFSAHVANIVSMDRSLVTPGLVLLDEVGSGTDPVEGGALGVAIIDHFRRCGATVVATSHYDALKTYASTSPGVTCAAFGFDPDTYAPTYQLIYGSPGRSLALEMAARLGLSPAVVAAARQNLTAREAQVAAHLAKIDHDMRALDHEQRLVARERDTLEAAKTRVRQGEEQLRNREALFRRRLNEELDAQVRQARREIDAVISALKAKTSAIAQDAARHTISTGETGAVRSDARAAVDTVVKQLLEPVPVPADAETEASQHPAVGDRVALGRLGIEGVVSALHDGMAEVDVHGKRMRVPVRDLRVVAQGRTPVTARVKVNVELQPRDSVASELNVIGCTVDEAIGRAERFLDESLLNDQHVVRVIHGYGTGQLKRALGRFLQDHPLVARVSLAGDGQGGGAVTVVELKD